MENNKAFVCYLKNIQKIEGADKIVQADVVLNDIKITQVVVGIDTKENSEVVYFDSNLCLSINFLKDNPELETYLAKHGRIRTIKLKGIISNGLAVDVLKFHKYFKNEKDAIKTLQHGYTFDKLYDIEICKKYYPPINVVSDNTKKKGKKGKRVSRMIDGQFNFHIDTDQFLRNIHKFKYIDIISISRKVHGTSAIVSNCLVKKKLNLFEKLLKKCNINIIDTEYDYIHASRTVVKNGAQSLGFYKEDIWTAAGEKYFKDKLHTGESVYYEIVGYLTSGSPIQKLNGKIYDYGCNPGEYKIYVYRITKTGVDGNVTEYGWNQLKERCKELNVDPVIELYYGRISDLIKDSNEDDFKEKLIKYLKETYLEKDCDLCFSKVPDEGIVIRKEQLHIESYKFKSEKFILGESKQQDSEELNIEDSQSLNQE